VFFATYSFFFYISEIIYNENFHIDFLEINIYKKRFESVFLCVIHFSFLRFFPYINATNKKMRKNFSEFRRRRDKSLGKNSHEERGELRIRSTQAEQSKVDL
jgi:hypothetical protein